MAGFNTIYCVGTEGGAFGADGLNPIAAQLWVGDGNRQWIEPRYFSKGLKPLGRLRVLIPEAPGADSSMHDALLAFLPSYFPANRKRLDEIAARLGAGRQLDLSSLDPDEIAEWRAVREATRPALAHIAVYRADLVVMQSPWDKAQRPRGRRTKT